MTDKILERIGSRPAPPSVPTAQTDGPVVANDEPGLAYRLEDRGDRIAFCVDHQSFLIGPEFDDEEDGRECRAFFKSMINVAIRRLVEKAASPTSGPSQAQDGYEADAIGEVNQAPSPPEKA